MSVHTLAQNDFAIRRKTNKKRCREKRSNLFSVHEKQMACQHRSRYSLLGRATTVLYIPRYIFFLSSPLGVVVLAFLVKATPPHRHNAQLDSATTHTKTRVVPVRGGVNLFRRVDDHLEHARPVSEV